MAWPFKQRSVSLASTGLGLDLGLVKFPACSGRPMESLKGESGVGFRHSVWLQNTRHRAWLCLVKHVPVESRGPGLQQPWRGGAVAGCVWCPVNNAGFLGSWCPFLPFDAQAPCCLHPPLAPWDPLWLSNFLLQLYLWHWFSSAPSWLHCSLYLVRPSPDKHRFCFVACWVSIWA